MIRAPARSSGPRGTQKSETLTLPSPVGGWNTRDSIANMSKTDATVMENWLAAGTQVSTRLGSAVQASGFTDKPTTLLPWNGATGKKLFVSTPTGIYDVTAPGVVGAAAAVCTNPYWESVNITTAGGSFLVAVNGVDKMKQYDGTAWKAIDGGSTPAITNVATTSLTSVAVMVQRLWFVEANSTRAWYLPVVSIGGAAVSFDLGAVFPRGGSLVCMQSWTLDGGSGADDYSAFMSSEGEVAVYKGVDPASSTTWAKVGTYFVGRPLGKRALTKLGGDLLIMSENGLFPLSKALVSADISRQNTISSKIDPTMIAAAVAYNANLGWRCTVFPQGSFILVNIPITSAYSEQYVMSTITNSWSKFTGWSASDFLVFGGNLYLCGATTVDHAWVGASDKGLAIVAKCQQAYNYFQNPAREKHMKMVRPTISAENAATIQVSLSTDFRNEFFPSTITVSPLTSAIWDTSTWDTGVWGGTPDTQLNWESLASKPFYAAGLRLQVASALTTISWSATNFVYELGGVL